MPRASATVDLPTPPLPVTTTSRLSRRSLTRRSLHAVTHSREGNPCAGANSRERMGLFNRATRHSGGNGGGHGPTTAGRESSADADLGAELAELGELVPEREEEEAPSMLDNPQSVQTPEPEADTAEGAVPVAETAQEPEVTADVAEALE